METPVRAFLSGAHINRALMVIGIFLAVGCTDPVTPESIAGTYTATLLTLSGEVTEDVLATGGTLTITFGADDTTSGSLFVPAVSAASEDVDLVVDMAGTFNLSDGSIHLTQTGDSFVRVLDWTVEGDQIRGTRTNAGVTVTVILSRQ